MTRSRTRRQRSSRSSRATSAPPTRFGCVHCASSSTCTPATQAISKRCGSCFAPTASGWSQRRARRWYTREHLHQPQEPARVDPIRHRSLPPLPLDRLGIHHARRASRLPFVPHVDAIRSRTRRVVMRDDLGYRICTTSAQEARSAESERTLYYSDPVHGAARRAQAEWNTARNEYAERDRRDLARLEQLRRDAAATAPVTRSSSPALQRIIDAAPTM